jgi:hypothetical protein
MSPEPRPKLAEPKSFSGNLAIGADALPLEIWIGVDPSGEVEFEFDPIKLSNDTKFILLSWYQKGDEFRYLSFKGSAEDGSRFETDHLHLSALDKTSDASGTHMRLKARCRKAELRYTLSKPAAFPVLRMRLRGFENLGSLHGECTLGRIAMSGEHSVEDRNAVTGSVIVQAVSVPEDLAAWRAEAEKLLEHIRRIMSLAASSLLRAPIFEFFYGDDAEATMWSQTRQDTSSFRVVHFLAQQEIFDAAIRSFFNPPVVVKNLFFAIEWFGMDAGYTEVRLVAAMTALENLIDANAIDAESLIQPRKEFDKTRGVLRAVIRKCLQKRSVDAADEVLKELNEKLADLNRRPLLAKLDLLSKRWGVPLDDISETSLRAAKNARDRIVHRGQYYADAKEADADLWTHVTVVREIAARFFLTAIGYKGRYISYIGGHHDAPFPPVLAGELAPPHAIKTE